MIDHSTALVPVTSADPIWGSLEAPVTIVEFSDFQCPYCSKAEATVEELKRSYGPAQLRVVWKNFPLPFHVYARPAAESAMTVFGLGGNPAFWKFHARAFANQQELFDTNFLRWAVEAGVDGTHFQNEIIARSHIAKIDDDMALVTKLGITGTPVFRINGVPLSGALPIENFKQIIDAQLAAAKALVAAGVPPAQVYPTLCTQNAAAAPAEALKAQEREKDDTTIWSVPVGKNDPTLGLVNALVTLVVFSDFECPFCRRLDETMFSLIQKYGQDLRIVWKDLPMPFHRRAIPAAVLARVAFNKKGATGFWKAHDALFANQADLEDLALKDIARLLGLSWAEIQKAIADQRFKNIFDESADLAKMVKISGTPVSFVNGYRITGAVPMDRFVALIDAQLAKARAMVDDGQAREGLYQVITRTGEQQVEVFERKEIEAPTWANPKKGDPKANVTVQIFGDFQCPYCQKLSPTLMQLEKRFKGNICFVWRNYPLAFHEDAPLAAEAAREVFVQKGERAFWKYHDLLFAAQTQTGLDRENLEKLAKKVGADMKRFREALDTRSHKPAVDKEIEVAKKAEIEGLPAVIINGYYVPGERSFAVYERVVNRALAESGEMANPPNAQP
jgi:protein-disulfide isomerase